MAQRILRASSSTLARQRQFQRPLFFSTSPQGTLFGDSDDHTASASTDANANADANNDGGPPTSVIYPRPNPFFLPSNKNTTTTAAPISTDKSKNSSSSSSNGSDSNNNNNNPLRLNLSQYVATLHYRIHVTCTHNNTHIVISDPEGRPLKQARWTGGSCGFKGVNRSGYEAGYQCAMRAFTRVKELASQGGGGAVPSARFEVLFSGFGQGRDAVFKALMTSEGDEVRPFVIRVTDKTPIKIGGTRAKKTRRL
jgi:small subunit ribosomal protein S11